MRKIKIERAHVAKIASFVEQHDRDLLKLFLGWTLIGWIIALIWSCTGNTTANFYRLEAGT
jgi:hypothetical protein